MPDAMAIRETVSVIIPVFNAENTLAKCLNSALAQRGLEVEVICVNDGSADSSLDALRSWERRDSRVVVLDQENQGSGPARNAGVVAARGDWIAFLDPDDWLPGECVYADLVASAHAYGTRIAGGNILRYDDDGRFAGEDRNRWFSGEHIRRFSETEDVFGFQRYIFRNDVFADADIAFPALYRGQDPVFMIQVMEVEDEFVALEQPVYCYSSKPGGNVAWNSRKRDDYITAIDMLARYSSLKEYAYMHTAALMRLAQDSVLVGIYLDEERERLREHYGAVLSRFDMSLLLDATVYDRVQIEIDHMDALVEEGEAAIKHYLAWRQRKVFLKNQAAFMLRWVFPALYRRLRAHYGVLAGRYGRYDAE